MARRFFVFLLEDTCAPGGLRICQKPASAGIKYTVIIHHMHPEVHHKSEKWHKMAICYGFNSRLSHHLKISAERRFFYFPRMIMRFFLILILVFETRKTINEP